MMHANRLLCLVAAAWLGLSAFGDDAEAGRCLRGRPCDGLAGERAPAFLGVQMAPDFGRKGRRTKQLRLFPQAFTSDDQFADNGFVEGNLIPESVAVNQALAAYPEGTPLSVKLLRNPSPVYVVKLKVGGQVLRVHIDAQSAQILGQ